MTELSKESDTINKSFWRKPKSKIKAKPDQAALPESVVIAEMAAEGGGMTIYGRMHPEGWRFFSGIRSYDCDEDSWFSHQTDQIEDIANLLPDY